MMRSLLVEAGHTAARFDPELQRVYQRLKFRRGASVAKVAIARKLAVRMYWMLRSHGGLRAAGSHARQLVGHPGGSSIIVGLIGRLASPKGRGV